MPYCSPADVRYALRQQGGGENASTDKVTGANLSDDQIEDEILQADSFIDTYIGRFYVTPVVSDGTVEPVRTWSQNLAAYLATLTYRLSKDFTEQDPVVRRYMMVLEQLKAVASGGLTLQLPEVSDTPEASKDDLSVASLYSGDLFIPGDFSLGEAPPFPGWNEGRWGGPGRSV